MSKKPGTENVLPHSWKPGQSGNPSGKKKGTRNVSTILRDMLEAHAPKSLQDQKVIREFAANGGKKLTNADVLAARMMISATIKGELSFMREIVDRVEGRAIQKTEVEQVEREVLAPELDEKIDRIYGRVMAEPEEPAESPE